jgi:hypothetical protein
MPCADPAGQGEKSKQARGQHILVRAKAWNHFRKNEAKRECRTYVEHVAVRFCVDG